MKKKKAWDAISDETYTQIWLQIRQTIHAPTDRQGATPAILGIFAKLSPDEKAALFNRLCCDYGKCVMFSGDSKRKGKLLLEFERTLDLMRSLAEDEGKL
jgi:hypothetical protein